MLTGSLAAVATLAQPALVCPTAPAGRPCDIYHFHVQMYRVDSRQFVEVFGINQFASQAACDRARDHHIAMNSRAIEHLRGIKQQVDFDRVGPCHCDMTADRTAPNHLTDQQRVAHLRTAEEIRLRLRERLLDEKVPADSEIVRGLWSEPPGTPQLAIPKLIPIPSGGAPAPVLTATEELKATKTISTSKPTMAGLDLPLVDVITQTPPPTNGTTAETTTPPPVESTPATTTTIPTTTTQTPVTTTTTPETTTAPEEVAPETEELVIETPVEPAETQPVEPAVETTTVPEEDIVSAQETAEQFVSYETQRIQNVLRAQAAIADETVKSKIFEACMQRIQLLSNLRLLIEGSGMRSRLATAARDAREETARLALIARLFGENVKPHWAPHDAADVIFEIEPEIVADPERALRDTTGAFTTDQKKRALYLVLAQTETTEDKRLWLGSVVEEFLR